MPSEEAAPSCGGGDIDGTAHASNRGGTAVSGTMGRLMQALCVICVFGDLIMIPKAYFWSEKEKKRKEEEGEEEGGKGRERKKKGRVNGLGYSPDKQLMSYLELAGFGSVALIQTFDLRYDLLSALVEYWRPEIHTFHLSNGECTVTLEDVALQLGLPIDERAITGVSAIAEPIALCYNLLGVLRNNAESKFTGLRFSWLKANFEHLSTNATEQEVMCVARALSGYRIGDQKLLSLYRRLPTFILTCGVLTHQLSISRQSSDITGIKYSGNLVASSISRICQCS
ncbi:hypothetical protein PVK06_035167 [Gossypium arboreum]|uniref:Aminotransferase-like plant mobile domain-containing protein n=1 Tax=Gossypium arboreum TaxID=29729 RepID=A0ABR0NG44_GOSAR|nr:hypothetical protein PVK06_035167 [Gossypium arboreum]